MRMRMHLLNEWIHVSLGSRRESFKINIDTDEKKIAIYLLSQSQTLTFSNKYRNKNSIIYEILKWI